MTIEELLNYLESIGVEDLDRFYRTMDQDLAECGLDAGEGMSEDERENMLRSYMKKTLVKDSPHLCELVSSIRNTLEQAMG
ncbi:MAG: hypothetical protein J5825_00790 [Lachnospiraceae bacterium]|nr:hypothetical protein [Lachnospiraceae bacterium]